jgi:hypothetical protein
MKSTFLALIALAVALMAGPALGVDLIADGGDASTQVDVGDITVSVVDSNLVVTITLVDPLDPNHVDWELIESHVHVADTASGIPQTGSGNPKVGKFEYKDSSSEATTVTTTVHEYTIPLSDVGNPGDTIYIAVQAAIEYVDNKGTGDTGDDETMEPSAWGGTWNGGTGELDTQFSGKNWASYFTYTIPGG